MARMPLRARHDRGVEGVDRSFAIVGRAVDVDVDRAGEHAIGILGARRGRLLAGERQDGPATATDRSRRRRGDRKDSESSRRIMSTWDAQSVNQHPRKLVSVGDDPFTPPG